MLYEELVPENGYIIGEIACGHEGDLGKLKQLIDCVVKDLVMDYFHDT